MTTDPLDEQLRELLLSDLFMDGLPANIHQAPITKAHYAWADKMIAQIRQTIKEYLEAGGEL